MYGHRHWKKIRTTFQGELEDYSKSGKICFGGDWVRCIQEEIGYDCLGE
jgi:hypothetical protein